MSSEWNIPRVSPTIEAVYKDELFIFTYFNSDLYYFVENEEVNHIFHQPQKNKFLYMFQCSEMMEQLICEGFPYHVAPWPSEQDLEAYVQSEIRELG